VSNSILNWTCRVAIAGRIAEYRRPQNWNGLTVPGEYHAPFGKAEDKSHEVVLAGLYHLIEK
jgi:hypothetical protein